MNDPAVPISKIGAYVLWGATAALLLAGWCVYFIDGLADLGLMLATSACITGMGGSTLTIRCYARHVSRLIRLTGGLPVPRRDHGLRSVAD